MPKSLVFIFSILLANICHGEVGKTQIDKAVGSYFAQQYLKKKSVVNHNSIFDLDAAPKIQHQPYCEEDDDNGSGTKPASCVDSVCKYIGDYNCNDFSEIERVGQICRGNNSGRCIESVCQKIGDYNCNDFSEIEKVAVMCRGSSSGRCIDVVCKRIGDYNCNEFSEIERVTKVCKGVRASCIEDVCTRIGDYNCNDFSEIERIASSCAGN